MDKRKNYYLIIDTETVDRIPRQDGKLDLANTLVYDLGYAIIDKKGTVYNGQSLAIAEIFSEEEKMQTAYFKDKIPAYYDELQEGSRILRRFKDVRADIAYILKSWNIKAVVAHNAHFDVSALNNTCEYLGIGEYFFPYGTMIYDTLKMSRDALNGKSYLTFCERNGYLTQYGRPRYTAEILYRYLSGDNNFIEAHTGYEDIMIEKEIFSYCITRHKKIRKECYNRK